MKESLVNLAKDLGFELCRVTSAGIPKHAEQFQEWLKEGAAGEMKWLERNETRRTNPAEVLNGVRSIIMVAMNYWQGSQQKPTAEEPLSASSPQAKRGVIARYAWGEDYHELIESKLAVLDQFLRKHGGVQKCYVDTGPVLERDFAADAGIGWHGKSTMLVNPQLGTWFFLAEILTTLEIPPDPPHPDRCGQCTRCMDACPTGAIVAPHKLDARRCISYLTIELKGSIPLEFRPLIGNRIYGCDDCLSACPWNRFAKEAQLAEFEARPAVQAMTLREFLALGDEQFRALFRKSPIKRIKRRGFLRNVCVALGNTGTAEDLPALKEAASDPEELIREHALWAIDQITKRSNS